MDRRSVWVAVFAHNEQDNITACLEDLRAQRTGDAWALHTVVLCNGCSDQTYEVARRAAEGWPVEAGTIEVRNLVEGGKARTWNAFMEDARAAGASRCVFVDGDIRIEDARALHKLLAHLEDASVSAAVSRPVPVFDAQMPRWLRVIFDRTKTEHADGAVCGMLYAARMEAIADVRLPVPCLVEDGFLAACLVTRMFSIPGTLALVRAAPDVSHTYVAPTSLDEFFKHSVRIELGTLMNAALFTPLWAAADLDERRRIVSDFARGRGMDEAFAAFQAREDNRAPRRRTLKRFARDAAQDARGGLVKAPLRIGKQAYLLAVRLRALELFTARTFRW